MDKFLRSKTPILLGACLSFLLSVYLWFSGFKDEGVFVAFVPEFVEITIEDNIRTAVKFVIEPKEDSH